MSDLEQYRQEIDELDEQLVRLFLRRMEVTGKVGEYKLAHGMQVLDRERERRVLAKRASLAVDIRQEEDVKELFQTIMAISRRRQQELIDRSGTGTVRKTNVVLIGMPGSGKSCVGAALAERLGMPLVETDAMVVEKTGRSIPDIFAQDGEAAFRREETAAARRAAAMEGTVISTGGGIILRPENMEILSATGTVYFPGTSPTRSWTAGPCSAGGGTGYSCCMISASTCTANMPGTPSPAPRWMRRWTPSWPWCGGARTCADREGAPPCPAARRGRETGVGK